MLHPLIHSPTQSTLKHLSVSNVPFASFKIKFSFHNSHFSLSTSQLLVNSKFYTSVMKVRCKIHKKILLFFCEKVLRVEIYTFLWKQTLILCTQFFISIAKKSSTYTYFFLLVGTFFINNFPLQLFHIFHN